MLSANNFGSLNGALFEGLSRTDQEISEEV
jgi:hypothetical protein